ncbi:BLOC-1-related complex subunit 7 [Hyposmocoma kahamanoa]|uniref:BLOC-1-related complex subunit 7 n=1 Tax=Hyposmocoma kahamanoa TaxID=1477025 RepID=UPI000E6D99D2|nr:BLOC-1-related complex subunit 7 [Hyposmocoma kahamanoa]
MTSASSSSARSLFAESKQRLAERVQVNMNNISSLTRQILRGSKSNELLSKASRDLVSMENQMENSEENLKKMHLIAVHMGYQFENIHKSAEMLNEISEQVASMKR